MTVRLKTSILLAGFSLVVLTGCIPTPPSLPAPVDSSATPVGEEPTGAPLPDESPVSEPAEEPMEEEPIAEDPLTGSDAPNLTVEQQEAFDQAEAYLQVMPFSPKGLADQLIFDGYPVEDAELAVRLLAVDWNEQAELKAKSYMDALSFSRTELAEQLTFDGFTPEQVEAGLVAVGY